MMKTKMKTKNARGGRRKGAGRPPAGTVRMELRVQPQTRAAMERQAAAEGVTPSGLLDALWG